MSWFVTSGSGETQALLPRWASALIMSAMSLLLVACGAASSGNGAHACGDTLQNSSATYGGVTTTNGCSAGHCYGIARWNGGYTSVGSTISVATLACNACSQQFADNEIWLSDANSNWIETGYGTFASGQIYSFWADNRATTIHDYTEHFLAAVSPGNTVTYSIVSSGSQSQAFDVTASSSNCSKQASTANGLSTTGNTFDIGLELFDALSTSNAPSCSSGGPTAGPAQFTGTTANGSPASGGTVITAGPPLHATWNSTTFTTSCP